MCQAPLIFIFFFPQLPRHQFPRKSLFDSNASSELMSLNMSVKSWLCGVHFRGGSPNTQLRTKIILLFVASVLVLVGVNVRNGLGGSLVTFAAARTAYIESNGLTLQNMVLSEHLQIYDDVRGDLQGAQITLRSLSLPNYNIFFQNFESTNAIIDIIACQFGTLQTNTHSTAGLLTMWTFSGVVANNAYFKWGAAMQSFVFFSVQVPRRRRCPTLLPEQLSNHERDGH